MRTSLSTSCYYHIIFPAPEKIAHLEKLAFLPKKANNYSFLRETQGFIARANTKRFLGVLLGSETITML